MEFYAAEEKEVDHLALYNLLRHYTLTYIYTGDLSETLNDCILSLAETDMQKSKEETSIRKKVYFMMVESLQNVTRHRTSPTTDNLFFICRMHQQYFITTGNRVRNDDVPFLKENLELINRLAPQELKEYSRTVLEKGELSGKGGAGLGLIEIARKSGDKLLYEFIRLDDQYSYFYFQTWTPAAKPGVNEELYKDLKQSKFLHEVVRKNKLSLFYHGEFSEENIKNILSLAEKNIGEGECAKLRKNIFDCISELLYNISFHADDNKQRPEGKFGMFLLGRKADRHWVSASSLILNNKLEDIQQKLEQINKLSEAEMDSMLAQMHSSGNMNGSGFINLRLISKDTLNYGFVQVDDRHSLLSISVHFRDS